VFDDVILYSLGFNGYVKCIEGLQRNLYNKKINFADFSDEKSDKGKGKGKEKMKNKRNRNNVVFKKCYYATLSGNHAKPVKNNINLKKNMIITGPNASGKTTILKSTIINIIFTQQFGCGFYDYAVFKPFHHIHCYLNIPDTSGRDSLFQAEARRCKEILDCIDSHPKDQHFCVFDELYSGTNPEEAETSATSFMTYLQKYKLVTSMLTTHFVKVCKKLDNVKTIQNFKMITDKDDKKHIVYTYKIAPGISEVKGGINVLTQLNYPKEIIEGSMKE
jgi:DNA mismatch repair ATPase MutS